MAKAPIHSCLLLLGIICVPLIGADKVAVVVNKNLKPLIQTHLDRYVADMTTDGYAPIVKEWDLAAADQNEAGELRTYLASVSGLTGAVFVGDLPIANYYNASDFNGAATFPYDLYFMDLSVTWLDANADGKIDGPTSGITPTIWVSRIKASNMGVFGGVSEADLVKRYLDKNHDYRTGVLRLPQRALQWSDTDWNYFTPSSLMGTTAYSATAATRVTDAPPSTFSTDRVDWTGRWQTAYETEFFMCHSSESIHQVSDNVSNSEVAAADIRRLFWNCWNCSSAKYTAGNYIAGVRLFTPKYGLIAIGSTKTGSMLSSSPFYTNLGNGQTHGKAFRTWFTSNYYNVSWHYGMTLLGDGTLRLGRYTQTPTPANTAPTISAIPAITVAEDTVSTAMSFTVGDSQTPADKLMVWAEFNRPVVPSMNVTCAGTGATRTLTVKSGKDLFGTVQLTVTVCDGELMTSTTCNVTVTAVNDVPTITNVVDKTHWNGVPNPTTAISLTDVDTALGSLTVTASSSDQSIVPNGGLVLTGTNGSRTLAITPQSNAAGTTTITLSVNDGTISANDTFVLTVIPALTPVIPQSATNGLNFAYYEKTGVTGVKTLDFSTQILSKSGTCGNFDLTLRNRDDDFLFRFTGYLKAPTDGVYSLSTTSDDGSVLRLGSTLVVDNDGIHNSQKRTGAIGLKAGFHPLTLDFFTTTGTESLGATWTVPGASEVAIPPSALWRSAVIQRVISLFGITSHVWDCVTPTDVIDLPQANGYSVFQLLNEQPALFLLKTGSVN